MALLWRQVWTLTSKTLRITLVRHWISTPLRAVILPILIVLLLSFVKSFLSKDSHYGFGEPHLIRPLSDMLGAASLGRDKVVFVTPFTGGEIQHVIEDVSTPLKESGVKTQVIQREVELRTACLSATNGNSKCLGAVVFHSSPSEGDSGTWNYTMRADGTLGQTFFSDSYNNDAQVYTLPLQHAIDFSIARHTSAANSTAFNISIHEYPFTTKTEQQRVDDNRARFMNMIKDVLAAPFYLSLACIIYQMTGFIATEQEIGMSKLLDTMMPNRARWQPQAIRITSNHLAFSIIYCIGWIATGAILGATCFPATTVIIPIIFHILAGLSTTSFAAFTASFFQKAQLSGIITIISGLALAIIAQLVKSGTATITILSLLFPPMNYVYCLVSMTRWESKDQPLNLIRNAPDGSFSVPVIVFWVFFMLHTIVYPILGAFVERTLYGTTSSSTKTVVSSSPIAVSLHGLTKAYPPDLLERAMSLWTKRIVEPVKAVNALSLQAYRGEIMVLLGANGSGKSTTLHAIAGHHSISDGEVSISYNSPHEGFGYCPQKNILWDDLTVREHVEIFDRIKSINPSPRQQLDTLIESCDLTQKKSGHSKSLSGGQKRKLQLAMMFAGQSTVCCVDEMSSGVDPLSRRRLWDILIAERGRRSIILTTHFLDEADILADRIAILSKGKLKALGSAVELKSKLGSGYRVHIRFTPGSHEKPPIYNNILHSEQNHEITYFPESSNDAHTLLKRLDQDGVENYEVGGPTLEDVFLKIEQDAVLENPDISDPQRHLLGPSNISDDLLKLGTARSVSLAAQMKALLLKRLKIFRRSPAPYIALLAVALVAAGCSTLFLQNATPGYCNPEDAVSSGGNDQSTVEYKLVTGPQEQLTASAIEKIAQAPPGSVSVVETLDNFNTAVSKRFSELNPGGFYLGSEPTIAWRADGPPIMAHITQNLLNSLLFNITINSDYDVLDVPFVSDLSHYLLFIIYFGLSMAVYPAFLVLHPTMERLQGIRSMHYSNGVRALPLWLSYLTFDFLFILVISLVSFIIFVATTNLWYAIGYLLLTLLLYGLAATLYCYVLSLYSESQLAAFALAAGTQVALFLIFFVIFVITYTSESSNQESTMNIAFFTLGLLSPVVNFLRALYIALNTFGVACSGKQLASYPGAINLFGGPILYLTLQSLVLFAIVLWKESGSGITPKLPHRKEKIEDIELEGPLYTHDYEKPGEGLNVVHLRKRFKKHLAVNDVSFNIPRGECFALIGPNGAGKSTTIAMIRGETKPTTSDSEIYVEGISALSNSAEARTRLGVCPQIDPLEHMTVSEHLHFYAQIRGLQDVAGSVKTIIDAVGLQLFSTRIASNLSGGNKRKLSLAIALVGNPSVLLLDEPSSGMDAVSKRIMWRTLSAVQPNRSLLLTTHSLEEADALATRAGIIAGKLLASGTISTLKSRHGNAYFVHLVHIDSPYTDLTEMERIQSWVQRVFPNYVSDERLTYGQIKFQIPLRSAGGVLSPAEIFGVLEEAKRDLGVKYYGIGLSTLDHIFANVVERHQVQEE